MTHIDGRYSAVPEGRVRLAPTSASKLVMHVCVCACRGLGVETAKNLILAGPGLVSLCDDEPVAMPDLGANFFLEEGDVGKPRAR